MSFHASIITLYPEMFPGPLGVSLAGKALVNNLWSLETVALRDFGNGPHNRVDDTPAGGGAGMVLKADVLANAIDATTHKKDTRPRLVMSPRGRILDQQFVKELAQGPGTIIVCGRFEGIDERVIETRGLIEISIGDYVLSGGETAALAMLDAVIRLLPSVMGNKESATHESHENNLLEYPQYTRPQLFENNPIPPVLLSGNHQEIDRWRQEKSIEITTQTRPDLIAKKAGKDSV